MTFSSSPPPSFVHRETTAPSLFKDHTLWNTRSRTHKHDEAVLRLEPPENTLLPPPPPPPPPPLPLPLLLPPSSLPFSPPKRVAPTPSLSLPPSLLAVTIKFIHLLLTLLCALAHVHIRPQPPMNPGKEREGGRAEGRAGGREGGREGS